MTRAVRPNRSLFALGLPLLVLGTVACSGTESAVFTQLSIANGSGGGDLLGGSEANGELSAREGEDPYLDPTVRFQWAEEIPGQGACSAGRYLGRFNCTGGQTLVPLEGTLEFVLEGSEEDQILTVSEGVVSGYTAAGAFADSVLAADLVGTLNCVTLVFDGHTADGSTFNLPVPGALPIPSGTPFEAALGGSINKNEGTIGGSWRMTMSAGGSCDGQFDARYSP